MSTTLASEAARQNARRKAFEQENKIVSGMLQDPDKLRSLAEKVSMESDTSIHCFKTSKRRTVSSDYRNGLVNKAFHVEMDRLGPLPSERSQECANNPTRNIASLKVGPVSKRIMESVDLSNDFSKTGLPRRQIQPSVLPTGTSNKRVYVTQPAVARRRSVDDRMTVTVFSSEKQPSRTGRETFRPGCRPKNDGIDGMNPLTRSRRALSYPSPNFDSWHDELKYWRNALKTSSKLKALEK